MVGEDTRVDNGNMSSLHNIQAAHNTMGNTDQAKAAAQQYVDYVDSTDATAREHWQSANSRAAVGGDKRTSYVKAVQKDPAYQKHLDWYDYTRMSQTARNTSEGQALLQNAVDAGHNWAFGHQKYHEYNTYKAAGTTNTAEARAVLQAAADRNHIWAKRELSSLDSAA